jgi:benzoylformate decarboxylase
MKRMTAREALVSMLVNHGVRHVFGNPGTTELPFLDALQDFPEIQYILALHEGVSVAMADGYARATSMPGFVNLHTVAGVANGLSMLYNAYRGGTPLVVTAGQLDTRMLMEEPVLGGDQVGICRQFTKWSAQVNHPKDVPTAVRRAFRAAVTPPTGPVFLSLPWDTLDGEDEMDTRAASLVYDKIGPDPRGIQEAASFLASSRRSLMLVGDRISQCSAVNEAVEMAETIGAEVNAVSFSEVNFPTGHPQFLGFFNVDNPGGAETLSSYDLILAIGCDVFSQFLHTKRLLDGSSILIHVDVASWEMEKNYPVSASIWGDISISLKELVRMTRSMMSGARRREAARRAKEIQRKKGQKRKEHNERIQRGSKRIPISTDWVMFELANLLPKEAVIVHEAVTTSVSLYRSFEFNEPGSLYGARGGALGWGIGGSMGVQMALPHRRVVAILGEGAAMYSIQGLWTAVRYELPVIFIICNNQSYRILKHFLVNYYYPTLGIRDRRSKFMGMDFSECPIRCSEIARSFGLWSAFVDEPGQLRDAFWDAFKRREPALIEISIDPGQY